MKKILYAVAMTALISFPLSAQAVTVVVADDDGQEIVIKLKGKSQPVTLESGTLVRLCGEACSLSVDGDDFIEFSTDDVVLLSQNKFQILEEEDISLDFAE